MSNSLKRRLLMTLASALLVPVSISYGATALITLGTVSDTEKGVAIGTGSNSLEAGIAVGSNADAVTGGSIAIGENSVAGKDNMNDPQDMTNRTTVGKRNNIAIGSGAVATGGRVISIGENAGKYTTDNWNIENVNVGTNAGSGSKRDYSVAIGYNAGYVSTEALQTTQQAVADLDRTPSVYIGKEAGKDTVSYGNIGIGQDAGKGLSTTNTGRSIMIGISAGFEMTSNDGKNATFDRSESKFGPGANILVGNAAGRKYSGDGTVALGNLAGDYSKGDNNLLFGHLAGAHSYNDRSIIVGTQAGDGNVNNDRAIVIGNGSNMKITTATRNVIAIGTGTHAIGQETIALGFIAKASANNATAIGRGANATETDAIAMGRATVVSGTSSIAIGTGNTVSGNNSGVFGDPSIVAGTSSYTFGNDNAVGSTSTGVFVLGTNNQIGATATYDSEGKLVSASGLKDTTAVTDAVSLGNRNYINTSGTYVLGSGINTTGSGASLATIGNTVANSVYLGDNTTATKASSVGTSNTTITGVAGVTTTAGDTGNVSSVEIGTIIYGNFAGATANGVVSVGASGSERRIQNVAAGEISATSTDAINGSQLYAVAEQVTTNADNIAKLTTTVGGNTTAITNLKTDVAVAKTEVISSNKSVTITSSPDATDGHTIYDLSVDTGATQLAYKANGSNSQTTSLSDGLNFTNGTNTTATVDANGIVTYSLNDDITVNNVTATTVNATTVDATTVKGDTITAGDTVTISNTGIDMGGAKVTNLQEGTISSTSTDAITGSQLYATNQQVNQNTSAISTLGRDVKKLDTRLDKVGAGAAALAALHPLDFDPDAKWDVTAGYGNYAGENAVAIGAFYRPNEDLMFSVGSSIGNGENMINAGVSVKVGANKGVTNSRVAMAKEIQEMKVAMKMLIEENKVIKANQRALNAGIKNVTFPDVPEGHWAYDYVKSLADKGLLEGYPDGTFKGNQPMTRYEIAAMVYRALQNGAPIDGKMGQALDEFENELDKIANSDRFRVDRVSGDDNKRHKIERVRVNSKDTKEVKRDIYGTTLEK